MSKPRKQHGVVVGVDGSLESDAAACWGATDAAMRNIPLTVVHVVNADVATWPPMPYPETWGVWQEDEGRQIVANAVKLAKEAVWSGSKAQRKERARIFHAGTYHG